MNDSDTSVRHTQTVPELAPPDAAAKIKRLRDRTNLPLMKCKFALLEANWDEDRAWQILYQQNRPTPFLY